MSRIGSLIVQFAGLALTALAVTTTAQAQQPSQQWPNKPITIVIAAAAGGVSDIGARLLAKVMTEKLGQQVNVEAKPGANGAIGTGFVARAQPDGYTILYGVSAALAINPLTMKDLPYESPKSFTPIQATWESPLVLVINPDKPFKTLDQFVKYAKDNPGAVRFGSGGVGSNGHLTAEQFQDVYGVKLTHVPYKGTAQESIDLVAGHIDAAFEYSSVVKTYVDQGKMLPLVQTGSARMPSFPNIPTMTELGYPQASSSSWAAMVGPAGMPQPVVDRLTAVMKDVIKSPEVVDYYTRNGSVVLTDVSGDRLRDFIADQITRYRAVIEKANIKLTD